MNRRDPLHVLLIGNYAPEHQQSMLRFGEVMMRGLTEAGVVATLLQPQPHWLGQRDPRGGWGKWLGYVDKYLRFPAIIRAAAQNHDVVHILDHSNSLYCRTVAHRPHVLTCHDLLAVRSARGEFPENRTRWSGRRLQAMILAGIRRARLVACVSRATAVDVARLAGIPAERAALVPVGLNHPYAPMASAQVVQILTMLGIEPGPRYLLHVGGNHWYKNRAMVPRIVAALRRLPGYADVRLVMAGEALDDATWRVVDEENLRPHMQQVTNVSNDQLNALYCGALGLVFPSLHEGFGWPVIEAQACGCPAFISERAPLPEVGGDDAVRFPPTDATLAATAIAAALARREALVEAGFRNVTRFTTKAMIEGYLALYRQVLG